MASPFEGLLSEAYGRIGEMLAEHSFAFRKADTTFYRRRDHGMDIICVGYVSHPGVDVNLTSSVFVRHTAVEDITNEFAAGVPPDLKKRSATVGTDLANLERTRRMRWTVACANDIVPATTDMVATYRQVAFPVFERFASLHEVLAVCSDDYGIETMYRPMDVDRAEKAVAAAFVRRAGCPQIGLKAYVFRSGRLPVWWL